MSLRSKLAERAHPYLEPGEQIQAVFKATSGLSPHWLALYILPFFIAYKFISHTLGWTLVSTALILTVLVTFIALSNVLCRGHLIVVTDRAIVVLDASRAWATFPTRLRLRHPRNVYFGRLSGLYGKFVLGNTDYWAPRLSFKDAATADAALTAMMQGQQPGRAATAPAGQQPPSLPPAGWYPDPTGGSAIRYWDGEGWAPPTEQVRPY